MEAAVDRKIIWRILIIVAVVAADPVRVVPIPVPAGMRTVGVLSDPPASSSSTRLLPSAESRLASTHPAVPPPAMM